MKRPGVKICGLTNPADARVAEAAGASYVGAVLVPGSPRRISSERASELAAAVRIPLVVVVADLSAKEVAAAAERAGASAVQLHGEESPDSVTELRMRGDWELWKAVRVRSEDDILRTFDRFGALVDLVLLDGWSRGQLGGTGKAFSWESAAAARRRAPSGLRIGVAGGLTPENVADAVRTLDPDLVDVSSGVESAPGRKDHERVRQFISRASTDRGRDAGR